MIIGTKNRYGKRHRQGLTFVLALLLVVLPVLVQPAHAAETPVMIKDIDPNNDGSYPSDLTVMNGVLYFRANDGTHGEELWKSDGTNAPSMVKDINPGSGIGSSPSNLTVVGDMLYFVADDGTHGEELWKYGGSDEIIVDYPVVYLPLITR